MSMINNPGQIMRAVSIYVLATVYTAALALAVVEKVMGTPIDAAVYAILSAALGIAVNQLGLHQGIVLVNSDTAAALKSLAAQQQATTAQQQATTTARGG